MITEEKIIEAINNNFVVDGFTAPLKWTLKRYIVWLTHNDKHSSSELFKQTNAFSLLDNINVWGWCDVNTGINYIDISTSTDDINLALSLWKLFNQIAIFDIENLTEITI